MYNAHAQDNLLKRKVSLKAGDEKLENILLEISDIANFTFSYDASILASNQRISYNSKNETVKATLDKVLPENIEYKVAGNHLILLKSLPFDDSRKKEKYNISGQVYHISTKAPLSNIIIYEVSSLISDVTDENGSFSMSVPTQFEQLSLSINNRDFKDSIIFITPEDQKIEILLRPVNTVPALDKIKVNPSPSVESLPLVRKLVPSQLFIRTQNLDFIRRRSAQVSFLPRLGSNLKMSGLIENRVSLNILAGYAYGVNAFELGGLFNIIRKDVQGFQIAGIGNVVGRNTSGFQLGGIFNHNKGSLSGFQIGGIANVLFDTLQGVQFAGISNVLNGRMEGWQVAGISNTTTENVDGVQFAGIINIATKDVKMLQLGGLANVSKNVNGTQLAGLINYTAGQVKGIQVAGLINTAKNSDGMQVAGIGNIATSKVTGAQIGSIFNYAKYVDGVQIGLFNIADSASGIPIGLLSFVKQGFHELEFSTNEIIPANVSFKTGVRKFYNIFSAGYGSWNGEKRWTFGYGVGTERLLSKKLSLNFEYSGNWVNEGDEFQEDLGLLNRLNINLILRKEKGFSFSAGPSINFWLSEWKDPETGDFLTSLAPNSIVKTEIGSSQAHLWIGGRVAIHW